MSRRVTSRQSSKESIESEIAQLRDLDFKALRIRWRGVTGRGAPPHVPKHLLLAILAYKLQADAFGDVDPASVRLLENANRGRQKLKELTDRVDQRNQELLPGAILTREWNGHPHRVTVLTTGYSWEGRTYESLSKIAGVITGTRWNGPRFFGLRANTVSEAQSAKGLA